jgi:hypothetical protein
MLSQDLKVVFKSIEELRKKEGKDDKIKIIKNQTS